MSIHGGCPVLLVSEKFFLSSPRPILRISIYPSVLLSLNLLVITVDAHFFTLAFLCSNSFCFHKLIHNA